MTRTRLDGTQQRLAMMEGGSRVTHDSRQGRSARVSCARQLVDGASCLLHGKPVLRAGRESHGCTNHAADVIGEDGQLPVAGACVHLDGVVLVADGLEVACNTHAGMGVREVRDRIGRSSTSGLGADSEAHY